MAGWLMQRLGNGLTGIIDPDNPDSPPSVTASMSYETFTRIVQGQFNNDEEVRLDRPDSYTGAFEYVAIAPAGSSTTDPVWKCVRCTWSNNKKARLQYLENIAWDNRTLAAW